MFLADLQLDYFLSGLPPTITHSIDAVNIQRNSWSRIWKDIERETRNMNYIPSCIGMSDEKEDQNNMVLQAIC